jgi:hypothetical protein
MSSLSGAPSIVVCRRCRPLATIRSSGAGSGFDSAGSCVVGFYFSFGRTGTGSGSAGADRRLEGREGIRIGIRRRWFGLLLVGEPLREMRAPPGHESLDVCVSERELIGVLDGDRKILEPRPQENGIHRRRITS